MLPVHREAWDESKRQSANSRRPHEAWDESKR